MKKLKIMPYFKRILIHSMLFISILSLGAFNIAQKSANGSAGIGNAHILSNKAKIIEIKSNHSIIVEIIPLDITSNTNNDSIGKIMRECEYSLVAGDVINAVFSETNKNAESTIQNLESGDIVVIYRSNYPDKINFEQLIPTVKLLGISKIY